MLENAHIRRDYEVAEAVSIIELSVYSVCLFFPYYGLVVDDAHHKVQLREGDEIPLVEEVVPHVSKAFQARQ